MLTRRAALTTIAGLMGAHAACAQTFPSRNILIVVPYPAGGPVDTVARLIAQAASGPLGQAIVVENRGGGSGAIGTAAVARAEPDGHTLVLGTNQTHATNQSLLKNCPYDAVKDFSAVAGIADIPHALVVRRGLEAAARCGREMAAGRGDEVGGGDQGGRRRGRIAFLLSSAATSPLAQAVCCTNPDAGHVRLYRRNHRVAMLFC